MLFSIGRTLATPGAITALENAGQTPATFLDRHVAGDWGSVDAGDFQANQDALTSGARLLSVYYTAYGVKLYVITEAADEVGNRSATTILKPEEY